ncbi:MAG: hypothetical protein J6U53_05190 [Tidjanibacter sp.]|nr:hypothetical protein [Tidjanibacter sp.]
MLKLSAKERIEKVICWTGLNTSSFAVQIGLSSPQSLYQIKAGKHNLSRTIAERICNRYPEIDFCWLFAGEGEMLRPQEASIPYYTIDCTEVALGKIPTLPTGRCNMVWCGDSDFAAPYTLRTMEPEVKQGSMLFCKECASGDIVSGGLYIFVLGGKSLLRKVGEVMEESVELVACDQRVAPLRIERRQIVRLYTIKASLEWKNTNL